MKMKVRKRDGRLVDFDISKIENAILKSFIAVDGQTSTYAKQKAYNIAQYIEGYIGYADGGAAEESEVGVEEIQDLVEKGLMSTKRKDVAKAYILYRDERNKIRNKNTELTKKITEKIFATNVVNQNANVDERSFGGRVGEASDEVMRQYALDYLVSPMARENHINNEIYIHDLSSYAIGDHNCLSIPFDDLLEKGFNTRQTDVRPANSINTAFQLIAVIFQLQSLQQFGGVSATHLDWTMVPYVRKSFHKHYVDGMKYVVGYKEVDLPFDPTIPIDSIEYTYVIGEDEERAYRYAMDMTERELEQAVEGMFHNLNTLQSRSGN